MFADKNDRRSKFGKFRVKEPTKPESELDYKNIEYLKTLVGPTGKILSRRRTGFDGQDQRKLANAVRLARFMGLMPFTGATHDPRDERPFRDSRGPRDARGPRDSRGGGEDDSASKDQNKESKES